jgi:hypothetical protein
MDSDKESKGSDSDAAEAHREGDVLGLGGPVPKSPSDPVTEFDQESIARRRARMKDTEETTGVADLPQGTGATGIDMGAGGSGTDIE